MCAEFQSCSLNLNDNKNLTRANEINKLLSPLHKALFIESNPSPVKYAASLLKLSPPTVRLPLVEVMESTKKEVQKALEVAKLL